MTQPPEYERRLTGAQPPEYERRLTMAQPPEYERRLTMAQPPEYERRPTISRPLEGEEDGNNSDLSPKDPGLQVLITSENINTRPRISENIDSQQAKVQFILPNNFYKNVSENKDIGKLISQLATCINATKKV